MSLALKFALAAAAGALALAVVLGGATFGTGRRALVRSFDATGAHLARMLALTDTEAWSSDRGTLVEAVDRILPRASEYGAYLERRFGLRIEPKGERGGEDGSKAKSVPPEVRAQEQRYREEFERLRKANIERLGGILRFGSSEGAAATHVVDAYLLIEGKASCVARAVPSGPMFRSLGPKETFTVGERGREIATDAEVLDGYLEGGPRVRGYVVPVLAEAGEVTHRAYVFLATSRLDEQVAALGRSIFLLAIVGVLGIAGISYAASRWMTRPILKLAEDLDAVASGRLDHAVHGGTGDEIDILARSTNALVRRIREGRLIPGGEFSKRRSPGSRPVQDN